jgi:hypothetical protein
LGEKLTPISVGRLEYCTTFWNVALITTHQLTVRMEWYAIWRKYHHRVACGHWLGLGGPSFVGGAQTHEERSDCLPGSPLPTEEEKRRGDGYGRGGEVAMVEARSKAGSRKPDEMV